MAAQISQANQVLNKITLSELTIQIQFIFGVLINMLSTIGKFGNALNRHFIESGAYILYCN